MTPMTSIIPYSRPTIHFDGTSYTELVCRRRLERCADVIATLWPHDRWSVPHRGQCRIRQHHGSLNLPLGNRPVLFEKRNLLGRGAYSDESRHRFRLKATIDSDAKHPVVGA